MSFTNNRFGKLTVIKKVREDVFLAWIIRDFASEKRKGALKE